MVLLVEDNATDAFVIQEVLAECGLDVDLEIVINGEEAIRYIDRCGACPSLILLDLNLPKVSGFEVLKRLRESDKCADTPVIIVSSSPAQSDRDETKKLGANGYFQKPITLSQFLELGPMIEKALADPKADLS
jgi:CheY-like chemotaxis protein